jgi:hypothetical protein
MRDDNDGVVELELLDQLLDLCRRNRIERRTGLIEQDHLWPHGDGARDAQALLLAAGEAQAVRLQFILDLVPQSRAAQGLLDATVNFGLREALIETNTEGDVVVDRHRKRRRLLKHHADAGAQEVQVLLGG